MFQRKIRLRIGAAFVFVVSTLFGAAQAQQQPVGAAENGRLWFVELEGAPVADGRQLNIAQAEKATFRRNAKAAGLQYTERRAFNVLFNGFSIEVHPRDRARLMEIPGVKAVYPVQVVHMPPVERTLAGAAPDLATAIAMTGANIAQTTLGLSGAGIKVGVMDTGIDIDHPDFGGNGTNGSTPFANHPRVKYGHDFVGDAFNADPASPAYNPVAVPDNNPDDCNGHGTHVAGIVGADGQVKGVAPGVTLGAYRVFGCDGSTTSDIMLAAMERALADGMHVLNMSIGAAFQWPQYPTAQAADRLVNKGMVVVASIGNSGASGLYSASAPGVGAKVIGVASYDNTQLTQNAFTISPGNVLVGFNLATGAPPPPTSGSGTVTATGTPASTDDGCSAAQFAGFPAGNIALIRRGTCAFHIKALNAQNAGAAAVVLYNNIAGALNPTVVGVPAITIPVVAISAADGVMIHGTAGATLTWGTQIVVSPIATGGLISSFSSYGLAPDLSLKPDIGAPGGSIFSTYPLELGRYASIGGTSMAAPHVAGGAALMLQAKPKTSSQTMRTILQNSADPKNWWGNPGLGFLDNVHRQGAGMLDIDDAILATTKIEPAKIAVGESQSGPFTQTLKIENKGAMAVTYHLSSVNALSTGANTFTPGFFLGNASVAFSAASVTVPAGATASVNATITPATTAETPDKGQYGGYIVLTDASDPAKIFRVPFAGFVGDYQSIQVLTSGGGPFPTLGWSPNGINFGLAGAGDVFTLQGQDIPYVLLHLDHQSRRLRIEAFDAVSGRAWHRVSDDEYLPRSSTATGFFAFAWDGTTFTGKGKNPKQWREVPNGSYVLKVSVLKALGDENNPAHWETWTSPNFTIARPPAP